MIKYNLGGGPKKIEGFLNVDALPWDGVTDVVWDLTEVPYGFVKESVDELVAVEVLEHISFRHTEKVLSEWYRILKMGGKLTIQVPNIGEMMEDYVNGLICDCVPHKVVKEEDFKADLWCEKCKGKAKVNTNRWLFAFTGAQKHDWDIHQNIFTKEILEEKLKKVGFSKVEFKNKLYKLVAVCYK